VEPEPQLLAIAEPEHISVLEPDLDPDPTQNTILKLKKNFMANFLGNDAASDNEKPRFFTIFFSTARYCLDPEPELEPKLF
jgi:hypothetical protein